jgi:hypothetical protein
MGPTPSVKFSFTGCCTYDWRRQSPRRTGPSPCRKCGHALLAHSSGQKKNQDEQETLRDLPTYVLTYLVPFWGERRIFRRARFCKRGKQ